MAYSLQYSKLNMRFHSYNSIQCKLISDDQLSALFQKEHGQAIVSFVAQWSSESQFIVFHNQRIAQKCANVEVLHVDVDEDKKHLRDFHIDRIPTSLLIVEGQVERVIKGCPPFHRYVREVEETFSGCQWTQDDIDQIYSDQSPNSFSNTKNDYDYKRIH